MVKPTRYSTLFFLFLIGLALSAEAEPRLCNEAEMAKLDVDGPQSKMWGEVPPYLQHVGSSHALVQWNSKKPTRASIVFSSPDKSTVKAESKNDEKHHVFGFCGLQPSTEYKYKAKNHPSYRFRTLPSPNAATIRFAIFGDTDGRRCRQGKILSEMANFDPDIIFIAGDVGYPRGRYKDYRKNFLTPYHSILSTFPVYPALGNHDMYRMRGRPYVDVFSLPHNNPEKSERYYSVDVGPAHFVVLDSTAKKSLRREESKQVKWLKNDLSSNTKKWVFVIFHHPPFTSGRHSSSKKLRKILHPIFASHGVDAVISGHNHSYERTHPQDGVTYFVAGGGGAKADKFRKVKSFTAKAIGQLHHFVGFVIDNEKLLLTTIDENGQKIDEWAKMKRNPSKN